MGSGVQARYANPMIIEDWVLFGLGASAASAGVMLVQEWMKASGFATAFWNKVTCVLLAFPFVLHFGLPDNPHFYMLLAAQAVLWAISDVYFFNAVSKSGAGVVSRLLPGSVILTFILWFAVKPELFSHYMETPAIFAAIFGVICLSAYFAMRLKNCPFSLAGAKALWFVIFASVVGPIAIKLVTEQTTIERGPYAMIFVEGLLMMSMWAVFYAVRRPIPWADLTSFHSIKTGVMVGFCSATMMFLNINAFFTVDNPAYLTAVKFLDSVIILLLYILTKRKDDSDIIAGLGVVACAAALVILKSLQG
jgi:hypothetical protein